MLKKGTKVHAKVAVVRDLSFEGKIKDSRKNYGRTDYLVEIKNVKPIWVSESNIGNL